MMASVPGSPLAFDFSAGRARSALSNFALNVMLKKHNMVIHKQDKPIIIRASCCLVGHCLTTGAFDQTE